MEYSVTMRAVLAIFPMERFAMSIHVAFPSELLFTEFTVEAFTDMDCFDMSLQVILAVKAFIAFLALEPHAVMSYFDVGLQFVEVPEVLGALGASIRSFIQIGPLTLG